MGNCLPSSTNIRKDVSCWNEYPSDQWLIQNSPQVPWHYPLNQPSTFLFHKTENKRTAKRHRDEAVIIVTSFLPLFYVHNKGCKGWHSGEKARLPLMRPGFKSRRRRHMWVEFVVGSFSPGTPVFPSPQKPTFLFQFDQESDIRRTTMWMCYLQLIIYLFIYLFMSTM